MFYLFEPVHSFVKITNTEQWIWWRTFKKIVQIIGSYNLQIQIKNIWIKKNRWECKVWRSTFSDKLVLIAKAGHAVVMHICSRIVTFFWIIKHMGYPDKSSRLLHEMYNYIPEILNGWKGVIVLLHEKAKLLTLWKIPKWTSSIIICPIRDPI